ncbi:LysM peptidoglycan-binding domain-containing protein [Bradyrhizobium sp. 21]|uniref:LysM peptidoglycan-binding domain-containing protein n=1 Tax=Bradyrhizobium sp. 21 TaxID=2782666 RepID=UPI001FF79FAD|nr:LysM peptidoglycan-binding domain-containing protein [Bradyrhizobium sp. 21]MCK1387637.1 LysM peptidoglycan-binding domain-containing protein [Bradyrhizobium sp. 21]
MTLVAVIAALTRSIRADGSIPLVHAVAIEPALTPLQPALARFTLLDTFELTGARLESGAITATLTGMGSWGPGSTPSSAWQPVAARLDCTAASAVAEAVTFRLTLTLQTPGWTFGKTFLTLPETQIASHGVIKPAASFLVSVQVDNAAFVGSTLPGETALAFSGTMPVSDVWRKLPNWTWLSGLIGTWPLRLAGTIALPATATDVPIIDLLATDPAARISLGQGLPSLTDLGFGMITRAAVNRAIIPIPAYSLLTFGGRVNVGTLSARVTYPVQGVSTSLPLSFNFPRENGDIVNNMSQLGQLFGLPALPTPPNFLPVSGFRFKTLQFFIRPDGRSGLTLDYIVATIESDKSWVSPLPFITIDKAGISWMLSFGRTTTISAQLYGTIAFESKRRVRIDVSLSIPSWEAAASLRDGDYIPITEVLKTYFGGVGPLTPPDMNVVELEIAADPRNQTYFAGAVIAFGQPAKQIPPGLIGEPDPLAKLPVVMAPVFQGWEIDLGILKVTLVNLSFQVSMIGGELAGGIAGEFLLGDPPPGGRAPTFTLLADYPGASSTDGWTFAGRLTPGDKLDLTQLATKFLGVTAPDCLPVLSIDRLYFSLTTQSKAYTFGGTISTLWNPKLFGETLAIAAAASLDLIKLPTSDKATGNLSGRFAINRLSLQLATSIGSPQPTYEIQVQFDNVWFRAVTSWRKTGKEPEHQVVTLQLGGVTVGGILEYLVNLASPTVGYSLPAPWNILNSIDLSRFTLTLDPTDNVVEFVYLANADLVFMRLDTIGIRYKRGEGGGVSLILTGDLLGQPYDGDDLSWDVINDNPPALPGAGDSFIDLRYLGLGQRVALSSLPDTVADTLKLLMTEIKPVDGSNKNPWPGGPLQWSPASQLLIGLDIGLLDTLDLGIIFNDPYLYGLSIALSGPEAGSMAGLKFEILYKKISDSVGMFRIELALPEAYRTFEMGAVSVTLGVVVIEIYTNGNFKIDLGFPHNRSFARSFVVQVFPFIGRGGIYFGLLNGTTSRRVPRITNGTFAPVIELGVGLSVGVGKEIHFGPLSGGIYVEVQVIFEGVIGWFHPAAAGEPVSIYYWAQGIAAIHGKLYGSVDFVVVRVSVTLEAYAAAMVTFEVHRPTLFALSVRVSAEAEVTILFVSVSFSFSVNVDVSFEVGSSSATPWILAADQSTTTIPSLRAQAALPWQPRRINARSVLGQSRQHNPLPRRRAAQRLAALAAMHQAAVLALRGAEGPAALAALDAPAFKWKPCKKVFVDSPRTRAMVVLPSFTVADVPLSWTAVVPVNPSPAYRFAMQMFAPSGVPPHARTAEAAKLRSAALSAHARDDGDLDALAADTLVRGLLLYCLYAIPAGPGSLGDTITAGQLAYCATHLNDPKATADGFDPKILGSFFTANIHLAVSGQPSGTTTYLGAMAVAIPPFFTWTSEQTTAVNLDADNKVGPRYIWDLAVAAAKFSPNVASPGKEPEDPEAAYRSYAGHVFGDWCLIIARAAVREALALLDNRTLAAATSTDTLHLIAGSIKQADISYQVRPGDTVETVADAVGATVDDLIYLNDDLAKKLAATPVGGSLSLFIGISPEVLAIDNPDCVLVGKNLTLGDIIAPVAARDTLTGLATTYNISASDILAVPGQGTDRRLLQPGSVFDAPLTNWTAAPTQMSVLRAAAIFYVRYAAPALIAADPDQRMAIWYSQAVSDLNNRVIKDPSNIDLATGELKPGVLLAIPNAYNDPTPASQGYTTVPGDTLVRIGMTLNLEQNRANEIGTEGWPLFRTGVSAVSGGYRLPTWPAVAIEPNETAEQLARRTVVNWVKSQAAVWGPDWTGLVGWIGAAPVLTPMTLITLPGVTLADAGGASFAKLSETYGLSLAEVGHRLSQVVGLVTGRKLVVRHLPIDTVDSLATRVTAEATGKISAEASRFLFSGQQVPVPIIVDGHTVASTNFSPLFDQTRQQWPLPVNSATPDAVALDLALRVLAGIDWITLNQSTTVGPGEDGAALRTRVPSAFTTRTNDGLVGGRNLPAGALVHTGSVTELHYSYTVAKVLDQVKATGLAWPPKTPAAPIQVLAHVPVTYGLAQHITLQTPIEIPKFPAQEVTPDKAAADDPPPQPKSFTLSVFPFPSALLARARANSTDDYAVYFGQSDTADAEPLTSGGFLSMIEFKVRRQIETQASYELVGADAQQRQLLVDLMAVDLKTIKKAYLALSPSTTAANPFGMQVVDGSADADGGGWLMKTNLSTETVPSASRAALVAGGPGVVRADLAHLDDFVRLLWEGSVVGGAGYLFGVTGGIADGAFDASDEAVLRLIVFTTPVPVASATVDAPIAAPLTHKLKRYDTCFFIVDQALPDGTLFVQADFTDKLDDTTIDPDEFVVQSLVPAGSAGIDLTLPRPIPPAKAPDSEAELMLRQSYSLLQPFAIATTNSPYDIPTSAPTVTPRPSDGKAVVPAWRRDRTRRLARAEARKVSTPVNATDPAPLPYWAYQSVLPVYRFGPASVAPTGVVGLPDATSDPYRGVGAAAGKPSIDLTLAFGDILGHRSKTAGLPVNVPLGYTDPLIGPSGWPGTTIAYVVAGTAAAPEIIVTLAAKAQSLMPATNQRGDALRIAAKKQQQLCQTIYFQYAQPGLTLALDTALDTGSPLAVTGGDRLAAFAAGSYAAASVATGFTPVIPPSATLGTTVANYGIGWEALAAANAGARLSDIFGSGVGLTVPAYVVFATGDSATTISTATRPTGWPTPTATAILSASANRDELPLKANAVLSYTPRAVTFAVPTTVPVTPYTLANAAAALATLPGWLAKDSAADAIINSGFVFTVDGVEIILGATPIDPGTPEVLVETLADATVAFENRGVHVSAYYLGELYADDATLLLVAAPGHTAHYVANGTATLANNGSGATADDLIANNLTVPDLYDPGALIYLGLFGSGTVMPGTTDTLAGFSARYGCPPATLLGANAPLVLPVATKLTIPGAVALPAEADILAPYTLTATDAKLSAVAARFDLPVASGATDLATRNAGMPGTVAPGQSFDVIVGGEAVPIQTDGLTSFAAVLAKVRATRSAATMADVAAAFETAGRLRIGGLLICPAAVLSSTTKPEDIPALYGVSATSFGLANAGIIGLLVTGQSLAAPNTKPALTPVTVLALDTLNSVVSRFNAEAVASGLPASITIGDVLAANAAKPILAPAIRALLPPADIQLTAQPSITENYPAAAFALTVGLTVTRPVDRMHPKFADTPAASTRAEIVAAATAVGDGSMTFQAFSAGFLRVYPNLRLATAKVEAEAADIWAVQFGKGGIVKVELKPTVAFDTTTQPRMLALAPLYNHLVSRPLVSVAPLKSDGTLDTAHPLVLDYQGIDVEVWATRFLTDFDRLLGPAMATALNDAGLFDDFTALMKTKANLQTVIPRDLTGVFKHSTNSDPPPRTVHDAAYDPGLTEARKHFTQWLGVSLTAGWSISTVLQYDAIVDSAWLKPKPAGGAALYGQPEAVTTTPASLPSPPPRKVPPCESWRLAAGKVSLDTTAPFLTVPLTVSDPTRQAVVRLDISYPVSNIEINVRNVDNTGYNRSDWLAMTPILTKDNRPAQLKLALGAADVPIPLRSFPVLPFLLAQTAQPVVPTTLSNAAEWIFETIYSHQHASQDHVMVTAEFNLTPPARLNAAIVDPVDLFTALAQYIQIADQLNGMLAVLDLAEGPPAPATRHAVATFNSVAAKVAELWPIRLLPVTGTAAANGADWTAAAAVTFAAVIVYPDVGPRRLGSYTLTRVGGDGDIVNFPDVACRRLDGTWITLAGATPVGSTRTYTPPPGSDLLLDVWPQLQLSWPGLNTGRVQNARTRVQVVRNLDLLGPSKPETADAFIQRTAIVTATSIVTPTIARTEPLAMHGANFQAALQAAFDELYPPATRPANLTLAIGLYYGYRLTTAIDGPVSELPVGLMPDQTLSATTAAAVASVLDIWRGKVKPETTGGSWVVSLLQYSSFDPGKRILLSIERLTYPLS